MAKHTATPSVAKAAAPAPEPAEKLFQHETDFISKYANNVRFHSTVHDLTLVFGQSDVTSGSEIVRQTTGITLPWSVVKIVQYYLRVNLAIHEATNGVVPVPPLQIPQAFPAPTKEMIAADPSVQKGYDAVTKLRDEFLAAL